MQELARNKDGKCLSKKYINTYTKLTWQCEESHMWKAMPMTIKQGSWCPTCSFKNREFPPFSNRYTLNDVIILAQEKGGKCLSTKYKSIVNKLKWQCKEGHVWETNLHCIKKGHWCPICARVKKLSLEEMQKLAKKRGGRCLSKEYINNRIKLKWECKKRHIWEAQPFSVKDGKWCAICMGNTKLTIEQMKELAVERGGECLSTIYKDNKTNLIWKCSKGHIWKSKPNYVKIGTWCPYCRITTIEEMQQLAESRGGKCLSKDYTNSLTKLIWQCGKNHIWDALPGNIKSGTWCPSCAVERRRG